MILFNAVHYFSGLPRRSHRRHNGRRCLVMEIDGGRQFAHGGDHGNFVWLAAFDKAPNKGVQR
jgi:hypothetical protein